MNYDHCIERYHFLTSEDSKSINLMHSMKILLLNLSSIAENLINVCINIVWMWELEHKESWVPKNWCFWTVVLKTLESPLDQTSKEIKPVRPKGNQSWMFTGRTDAEAEAPLVWPPDAKNWLIGKALDAGKDWRQEEKGTTGRDSWMASLTQWIWVWASSRSWWWTGKPGVLQFVGLQRAGHDWATEMN